MRKIIILSLLIGLGLFSTPNAEAQPPNPPGNPSSGGGPVGGTADLKGGSILLLALGGIYAFRKYSHSIIKTSE